MDFGAPCDSCTAAKFPYPAPSCCPHEEDKANEDADGSRTHVQAAADTGKAAGMADMQQLLKRVENLEIETKYLRRRPVPATRK